MPTDAPNLLLTPTYMGGKGHYDPPSILEDQQMDHVLQYGRC